MLDKYYTPTLQAALGVGAISEREAVLQYNTAPLAMPAGADVFCWPDTVMPMSNPLASSSVGHVDANAFSSTLENAHIAQQTIGEPDMDFSLTHFLDSAYSSPRQSNQSAGAPATSSANTGSTQTYSLNELYQMLSCAPSHSDVNWVNPVL